MKKENNILELFFNEPTKHWHFEEIVKKANISRPQANAWLKKFVKEELIKKSKIKGKMPYYTSFFENNNFKSKKRLFAFEKMQKTGFLNHLMSLKNAKTITIFGSFARSDWYSDSDIDLFIYGDITGLERGEYELKLGREIQIFNPKNKEDLKKFGNGLMTNIVRGITIKGLFDFLEVKPNA